MNIQNMDIKQSWSTGKYYIVDKDKYLSFQYPETDSYLHGPFDTERKARDIYIQILYQQTEFQHTPYFF